MIKNVRCLNKIIPLRKHSTFDYIYFGEHESQATLQYKMEALWYSSNYVLHIQNTGRPQAITKEVIKLQEQ